MKWFEGEVNQLGVIGDCSSYSGNIKVTMDLSLYFIHSTLNRFREYLELVETSLRLKEGEFSSRMKTQAEQMSPEEREEYFDYHIDDFLAYRDDYPDLLRKSIFIASFSLLEHKLINLCKNLKKKNSLKLDIAEINGKGILKVQVYLKKVANTTFPDDSIYWKDILIYQQIRNIIVHNDSVLKESDETKNVAQFISEKSKLLKLDALKRINFENEFCLEVLQTIEEFLIKVYSGMSSKEYFQKLRDANREIL